jgi:hypothetical protein
MGKEAYRPLKVVFFKEILETYRNDHEKIIDFLFNKLECIVLVPDKHLNIGITKDKDDEKAS